MTLVVAAFLTITGDTITYIAVGMARSDERRKNVRDCDEQLSALRRQLTRGARPSR